MLSCEAGNEGTAEDLLGYEVSFFRSELGTLMFMKALHPEICLKSPGFDELRDNFDGLVVRIRDRAGRALNVNFPAVWQYTKVDETFANFLTKSIVTTLESGASPHWLYELSESDHFALFKQNNPHFEAVPELKEWLVILFNEVISVIGRGEPIISDRTDSVRSFTDADQCLAEIGDANDVVTIMVSDPWEFPDENEGRTGFVG